LKFCTETRGLDEEKNKEYAKDLKEFAKKEAKKFRNDKEEDEDEE